MKYVGLQERRTAMKIKVYNSKKFAEYKKEYEQHMDAVAKSRRLWYEAMDAMWTNPTDKKIDYCDYARSEYERRQDELYAYKKFLVENVLFGKN